MRDSRENRTELQYFELLEYASHLKGKNYDKVKLSHSARSGKNNQPSGLCASEVQESTNDIFVYRISCNPTFGFFR